MLFCPRGMKYNAQIGVGVNLSDTGEYNTSLSIKLTPTPEVNSPLNKKIINKQ